jgi:hypothetical protein
MHIDLVVHCHNQSRVASHAAEAVGEDDPAAGKEILIKIQKII